MNENVKIPIQTSLKFVPMGPFDNKYALVQVMAWHRTHICGDELEVVDDTRGSRQSEKISFYMIFIDF